MTKLFFPVMCMLNFNDDYYYDADSVERIGTIAYKSKEKAWEHVYDLIDANNKSITFEDMFDSDWGSKDEFLNDLNKELAELECHAGYIATENDSLRSLCVIYPKVEVIKILNSISPITYGYVQEIDVEEDN